MASRLNRTLGIITTLRRAGMIAPMRPDRYLKMAAAMRREGMGKVPRELSVLDELPRGSTGKVLRIELKSRVSG
jgi:acyl-coenzyme A synthetase/AMP-(fatty) acid ligase